MLHLNFPPIFAVLKVTCLVTLFDCKLRLFSKTRQNGIFLAFLINFCAFKMFACNVIFKHRVKVSFVIGTTFSQDWKLSFNLKEGPLIQTEHLTFRPRLAPRKRPGQDMLGTTNKVTLKLIYSTPLCNLGKNSGWKMNSFLPIIWARWKPFSIQFWTCLQTTRPFGL